MSIKSKYGVLSISNDYITWYFYEEAFVSAGTALAAGDIAKLYELSILSMDLTTNLAIESNWSHEVTNAFSLFNHIKRARLGREKE